MAALKPEQASTVKTINQFGGLEYPARLSADSAAEMRNFRILSDGSLEKRCGYESRIRFSNPIRGIWQGMIMETSYLFVVAGDTVYRKRADDNAVTPIYYLSNSTESVTFVFYNGWLYLLDGSTVLIYRTSISNFMTANGYTPLYGRNWHPTELGEVYERPNLIQNSLRVHYLNSGAATTFRLPFTAASIERVKVNGSGISSYTFTPETSSFSIPSSVATVGTVEVLFTPSAAFSRRPQTVKAKNASVYWDSKHETLMCFDGKSGYHVYCSRPVSKEMLDQCNLICVNADALYLPDDLSFAVGSHQQPIQALCQLREQMLVLNEDNVWAIRHTNTSDELDIFHIRSGVGCCTVNGVCRADNSIVTVDSGGLLRLNFRTGDPDFCETEYLSPAQNRLWGADALKNATVFWEKRENELWFRDRNDDGAVVWILDPDHGNWYSFDNVPANEFLELDGCTAFCASDGGLCVFNEALSADDESGIQATYLSHFFDFSKPDQLKRVMRAVLCLQSVGGTVTLELETERGSKSFSFSASSEDVPEVLDKRVAIGRFRFLRFRLTAAGNDRSRIYSLSLAANP